MLEMGLIKSSSNGMFHLLPLFQKSMEKCICLVDDCMNEVGAQKITMPILTPSELWKKSGRYGSAATELLLVRDRHEKEYILSPTHEEGITAMLATISPLSYRGLPLKLYQITPKFRDELKPRFGLLRTKEFLMKDLYTFDTSLDTARQTYDEIHQGYESLFNKIGVKFSKIAADTGIMGGSMSHEYHYESGIGEDILINCPTCNFKGNEELTNGLNVCPKCKSNDIQKSMGIEIAHTFVLEDKYTKPLNATFLQANGKPAPMVMGCYGIGITRITAATIEILSLDDQIRWPFRLAPYTVCIIPPKSGSKEEEKVKSIFDNLCHEIAQISGVSKKDVIVDDRTNMTIGRRFLEAKRTGYPFVLVIGEKAANEVPLIECHDQTNESKVLLEPSALLQYLNERIKSLIS